MSKRLTDRTHLEYVASLPCLICKAGFYVGSNNIQAHHLLKPWSGKRGMSLRAGDNNVIPLCFHHHSLLHTKFGSESAFFKHYGLPANYGQMWAKKLWEKSPTNNEEIDNLPF